MADDPSIRLREVPAASAGGAAGTPGTLLRDLARDDHGDRDLAALGERIVAENERSWLL